MFTLALALIILFVIVMIVVVCLVAQPPKMTIIQDLNIPNFHGNEQLLQSLVTTPLKIVNVTNSQEVLSALDGASSHVLLQISSDLLSDPDVVRKIKSMKSTSFISNASSISSLREELPQVYYILGTDTQLIRTALTPYSPASNPSKPAVVLSYGTGLYFDTLKDEAMAMDIEVFDLTGDVPLTDPQKTTLANSAAVFISSFEANQPFVLSQISPDYDGIIAFLNVGPYSGFDRASFASAIIQVVYPTISVNASSLSEWSKANASIPGVPIHPLVASVPTLAQINNWGTLINLGIIAPTPVSVLNGLRGSDFTGSWPDGSTFYSAIMSA